MNWKLIFKHSGTFVELYDKNGKVILTRPFIGWERRPMDEEVSQICPKFDLRPGESVTQNEKTGDLVYRFK